MPASTKMDGFVVYRDLGNSLAVYFFSDGQSHMNELFRAEFEGCQPMKTFLSILVFCSALLRAFPQMIRQPLPQSKEGRIVMYDWFSHELTVSEDFVVETKDNQYLRVVYAPLTPEQSSNESLKLDRLAFIGRGRLWKFDLHAPLSEQERMDCSHPAPDAEIDDEKGHERISVYMRSPGAQNIRIPPIETLPCYVLSVGGMRPVGVAAVK